MSFPTVKTSPWQKRKRRRAARPSLWSDRQWARLVDAARREFGFAWESPNLSGYGIGPNVLALISLFNERSE